MCPMVNIILFMTMAVPVSGMAFNARRLETPNARTNASMPRVLLFVTTYPSDEHVSFMKCQADLLSRTQMLKEVDVLLHVGEPPAGASTGLSREAWRELLDAWPMHEKTLKFSTNPGKQRGAKKAMHEALTLGWFRDYDWVVRINPDVIIYDERPLFSLIQRSENWAVVARCGKRKNWAKRRQTNSDFFAIRPEHVPIDAFSGWNTDSPNAETVTTIAFQHIYDAGAYAFLKPELYQDLCHLQDGSVYHGREGSCEAAMAKQGWEHSFTSEPTSLDTHSSIDSPLWQEAWRLIA